MRNITPSDKVLLVYRGLLVFLSLFTLITGWTISSITSGLPLIWLNGFKYYTTQTNILVLVWLILAIVWHNKPEALEKISGPIKGALTLFITTTFVFFAILLQASYHPTGFSAFSNIVLHYLIPIAFIVDWLLTETKIRYKWIYLPYWIIYPVCYLVFSFVHGTLTGDYIYPFLDISQRGILRYIIIVIFLIGVGIAIASLYIAINRKRTEN